MEKNQPKKNGHITPEMLREMQLELKEYDMDWLTHLYEQIKATKGLEDRFLKNLNEKKVYRVFIGQIKNGAWKVLVFLNVNHPSFPPRFSLA